MRIGELSRRTDVSTETLRYYEKRGLITAQRRDNGYRDFDGATVRLVGLLRLGQSLGFSLAQMQKNCGCDHPSGDGRARGRGVANRQDVGN